MESSINKTWYLNIQWNEELVIVVTFQRLFYLHAAKVFTPSCRNSQQLITVFVIGSVVAAEPTAFNFVILNLIDSVNIFP